MPLAKLPRSAHGFRIALVSDIHLGAVLGRGFAEKVVATVNATQPDLIAVVGDLADGSVADLRSAAEPLAGLRARHGAYFVTGNHEYFSGAEEWTRYVQELGLRLLANERVELPAFDLAGVTTSPASSTATAPTSRPRWATGTRRGPRCCWPISRSSSTRRSATGWTCSCPATPTAASCGRSTIWRPW